MDKKHEQDFADLEVKRLCGVFGTPIPALPPERDKALDKVKEPPLTSRMLDGVLTNQAPPPEQEKPLDKVKEPPHRRRSLDREER